LAIVFDKFGWWWNNCTVIYRILDILLYNMADNSTNRLFQAYSYSGESDFVGFEAIAQR
jgi:hypothetical protein